MMTTVRSADFIGTLGVNTHIDFAAYGYQNLSAVAASINYLGIKSLRDSPQSVADTGINGSWQQIAAATGAKFDAYIPEGSLADMQASLNLMPQLAGQGILNSIEGANEEDDPYAAGLGNTLQIAANFQKNSVWPMGRQLHLPVINMSFGAGWTANNGWIGDYGSVGDLANYASYGNAHAYPTAGQTPDSTIQRIDGLAKLADSTDPVITTEIGWDRNQGYSRQTVAKFVLDAAMDGIKDGSVKTYFYGLFDDGAGEFGLMNQDGTPLAAGTAIHNLIALLSDGSVNRSTFTTGSLSYTLSHTTSNDNSLLLEKADGTYWISLWNESDSAHNVTVTPATRAAEIRIFDPLTGMTAITDVRGASSVTLSVTDHPQLVEVFPSGNPPPPPAPPAVTTGSGPDNLTLRIAEDAYLGNAQFSVSLDGQQLGGIFTTIALQSASVAQDFIFKGDWATGGHTVTVKFLNDAWGGTAATDRNLYVDGLTYDGASTAQTAALYATGQRNFTVNDTTPSAGQASTSTIASTDASPVVLDSNVIIIATSGDHMLFIGGTHDVAALTGGTETVQAYQGYNTITTGSGNDSIRIAGSGNVIDAGSGSNRIEDSGSANSLVMPKSGVDDVFGYVIQNGDTVDFRAALQATTWDGQQSTLGNFLHVSMQGSDAVITISAAASGTTVGTMTLHDSGPLTIAGLLGHAVT